MDAGDIMIGLLFGIMSLAHSIMIIVNGIRKGGLLQAFAGLALGIIISLIIMSQAREYKHYQSKTKPVEGIIINADSISS